MPPVSSLQYSAKWSKPSAIVLNAKTVLKSNAPLVTVINEIDHQTKNKMEINNNDDTALFCATVLYPYTEGVPFDYDYYAHGLLPLYVEILGDNCVKFEVRKGLATPGYPVPHFMCIASFWLKSAQQFGASMADPAMKDIMLKIAAFTNVQPIRQFDQVIP